MSVVDSSFEHPLKLEEEAVAPLAGGLMLGYQCGMLWGTTLAAGAQVYRLLGTGPQSETVSVVAAQRLVKSFSARDNKINCLDITGVEWKQPSKRLYILQIFKYFIKGGPIGCFRMAGRYAREAYNEINSALSEKYVEIPSPPISCAAVVAQKMGASDMQTVMAAGLAGGIGLSGGTCGALGATIWIIGMEGRKEQVDKKVIKSRIDNTIDRFNKSVGSKFECSEIVGRRFNNIFDHADYLHNGGCSKIIEVLATTS